MNRHTKANFELAGQPQVGNFCGHLMAKLLWPNTSALPTRASASQCLYSFSLRPPQTMALLASRGRE